MLISFVGWVSIGLAAGAVARLLRHGPDAMGSMRAILLGVTGSLLGGGFASLLDFRTSTTQGWGWTLSLIGAIVLLAAGSLWDHARRAL